MKTKNPERIYVDSYVGSNGIHCLDYKNYDDSIEYIRSDLVSNFVNPLLDEVRTDVELAVKLSKYVHDNCKEVPHDIGMKLMEIISEHFA